MVLLPVGVAPPVAAGGATQPDPTDGLGRPDCRRRRLLLLLRMRGLSQLRLTSNIRLHVVLGEGTRVGGLFEYEYDTTQIDIHAIWFKWDRLCGTISKFLAFMWDI